MRLSKTVLVLDKPNYIEKKPVSVGLVPLIARPSKKLAEPLAGRKNLLSKVLDWKIWRFGGKNVFCQAFGLGGPRCHPGGSLTKILDNASASIQWTLGVLRSAFNQKWLHRLHASQNPRPFDISDQSELFGSSFGAGFSGICRFFGDFQGPLQQPDLKASHKDKESAEDHKRPVRNTLYRINNDPRYGCDPYGLLSGLLFVAGCFIGAIAFIAFGCKRLRKGSRLTGLSVLFLGVLLDVLGCSTMVLGPPWTWTRFLRHEGQGCEQGKGQTCHMPILHSGKTVIVARKKDLPNHFRVDAQHAEFQDSTMKIRIRTLPKSADYTNDAYDDRARFLAPLGMTGSGR